ncbi:MAG: polysaccharide deacetylase family protein [Actinomycetota bacterium]
MQLRSLARDAYRFAVERSVMGRHVLWRAPLAGVALTFDDGPDPVQTPRVLDALAELGARATFFVVGAQADRHPELIRRIQSDGHQLGNHTYSHFHCPELDLGGLMRQIERTDDAVEAALGLELAEPLLFRPPFGELHPRQALYLAMRGRSVAFWSRDSRDYRGATAGEIAALGATLGSRDVLLLHDRFPNTVEALPTLLETLQRRGMRTVTLDESPAPMPAASAPRRRRATAA